MGLPSRPHLFFSVLLALASRRLDGSAGPDPHGREQGAQSGGVSSVTSGVLISEGGRELGASASTSRWPVMSVPATRPGDVERPAVIEALLHLLNAAEGGDAMTTALTGAGGFGKTTAARMLVHREEVRRRFPDGILWISLGEDARGQAWPSA